MERMNFGNVLEVEKMRRKIFLQICRFKVMVENIKTNIKNLTKRGDARTKTVQGLDFSL